MTQYTEPLQSGEFYEIRQLVHPRIAENLQFIWNYALINKMNNVAEIHTDTYPGAVMMFLKFEKGWTETMDELAKYIKQQASKNRPRVLSSAH